MSEEQKPGGRNVGLSTLLGEPKPACDCLDNCGDDAENIKAGKCEPCPAWKQREQARVQHERHAALKRFYGVTSAEGLIDAQAHQIERLQQMLSAAKPHDSGRVMFPRG